MSFLYFKALHIIFVVSWFAGLFYIVRLFIYHVEAFDKVETEKDVLTKQFQIMEKRLMNIITTPAMALTIIFGGLMLYMNPAYLKLPWMHLKIGLVVLLIGYHHICISYMKKLRKGLIPLSSTKLRMFNEIATLLLFAIVFLVVLRNMLNMVWGVVGLFGIALIFMILIKIYKKQREKS